MSAINKSAVATFFGTNEKPSDIRANCKSEFRLQTLDISVPHQGAFGAVSEACLGSECKYIVKSLPLATNTQQRLFYREVDISTALGKAGISPKVYDVFICLNTGYIIMEKWDGDYRNILRKDGETHENDLFAIATVTQKMHRLGVIHNDLHVGNILYKGKGETRIFGITDFGLAMRFDSPQDVLEPKDLPNHISPNIFFPAFDYYKIGLSIETLLSKAFESFFLKQGYMSFIEYILVEKFLFYEIEIHDVRKYPSFLKFLQDEDIARDMRRTLPVNQDESYIPKIKEISKDETYINDDNQGKNNKINGTLSKNNANKKKNKNK